MQIFDSICDGLPRGRLLALRPNIHEVFRFGLTSAPCSDAEYMTGALLQVNWAPVWKSGGLLEWFEEARFAQISDKIKNSAKISECYVRKFQIST
jgi:hypothetical protein